MKETTMSSTDLPRHIVARFESRWAKKLEQQARAWKNARSESRSLTEHGIPSFGARNARGRHKNRLEGSRSVLADSTADSAQSRG
jgi:hypothetical protein